MTVSMDMSEVRSLAQHLRRAETRLTPPLEALLTVRANAAASDARATAQSDAADPRPWLGTEEGIVVRRRRKLERSIVSPKDPEGQSVGYRIEEGTSVIPPRPFLAPALTRQRDQFNRDALALLVKATL